jgi:hypothetical protein
MKTRFETDSNWIDDYFPTYVTAERLEGVVQVVQVVQEAQVRMGSARRDPGLAGLWAHYCLYVEGRVG